MDNGGQFTTLIKDTGNIAPVRTTVREENVLNLRILPTIR
jgi:hypothetical protein